MSTDDMPADVDPEAMLTLSDDRTAVRLSLPLLPIVGLPEPLKVHMDWDAETVDAMMARLAVLRARML